MKKLLSVVLSLVMLTMMVSCVFAAGSMPSVGTANVGSISGLVGKVLGAIRWVGYAIAMGMLLYIGVKYVMASANEKADLKKGAINYVIGVIVLVAASTIFGFIQGAVQ